ERAAYPDTAPQSSPASAAKASGFRLTTLLRSGVFISISVPFALGLTAQVGFLTHQIGFLSPSIGTVAAGWVVSLTTFAAVLGRIATGYIADQFDQRPVACVNFIVQMLGIAILATATAPGLLACRSMEALAALIVISPAIVRCRKAGRVTG